MSEHSFYEVGLRTPKYEFIKLNGDINPMKPIYTVDVFCTTCNRYYVINQDREIVHEY